jgi:hypothetical protein
VDSFDSSNSHFITGLLHEVVENLVVTLDHGVYFLEDVLAKSFPYKGILSLGLYHGGKD